MKLDIISLATLHTGSLSCTRTKWMHKLDFPHLDWPIATFPTYQYPMEKHKSENCKEDAQSLQEVFFKPHLLCVAKVFLVFFIT